MSPRTCPLLLAAVLLALGASAAVGAEGPQREGHRNVAILVYDGVEILDLAGPAEVFEIAGLFAKQEEGPALRLFTVAASRATVESQNFLDLVPDYAFADAPRIDLLVLPGGRTGGVVRDPTAVSWIRRVAAEAELTLTVCTGAMVLAETGLLNEHAATTWHGALGRLARDFPKVDAQPGRRVVDAGRFVSTAGVSAGIDGALHVVARLLGRHVAHQTAAYMEYDWSPEPALAGDYAWLNPSRDGRGRLVQQADLLLADESWEQAATAYRALAEQQPGDARSWYRLGKARLALGDLEGTVAASQRAAASASFRAVAEYNIACAYARSGDLDAALSHLASALAAGLPVSPTYLRADPDLEALATHPGFAAMLAKLEGGGQNP